MIDKINEFVEQPLPRKILFFDDMLTPSLIQMAYWLGLLTVVWTGLDHMFSNGFFGFFEGIVRIVFSAIVLRVVAEIVMLVFQIHENSEIIAANSKQPAKAASKVAKKVSKKVSKKATSEE